MSCVKRYSLAANSKNQKEVLIGIDINDKGIPVISGQRGLLSAIDKYTMQFKNEEELKEELCLIGAIDSNASLYVRYMWNGPKKTDILYSGDDKMLPFVNELSSEVSTTTSHFNDLLIKLLKTTRNEKFMNFLNQEGYIPDHLYKYLVQYSEGSNSSVDIKFLSNKIAKSLSAYKVIRDIYLAQNKYVSLNTQNSNSNFNKVINNVSNTDTKSEIVLTNDEQEMLDIYLHGGEEELHNLYDEIPQSVASKIKEYHKRGL
ncbi:MAG: hypothetical protein IJ565_02265 [Bacilli bacterium]|nr:hypothetical protein [Bacilli bacterium]